LKKQTHSRTLAQKALAYGLPGIQVDGNDVLAVYAATREAVERARDDGGPTLIESVTYRLGGHTPAHDPPRHPAGAEGRAWGKKEEVRAWEKKDPLTRFHTYLEKKNLLEAGMEEELDAEIAAGVRAFEAVAAAEPLGMFDHAYGALTPDLDAQRAELAERVGNAGADRPAGHDGQPAAPPPMRGQRVKSRWQN